MRVRPRRGQKVRPSGGHTCTISNFSKLRENPFRSQVIEALDHKWLFYFSFFDVSFLFILSFWNKPLGF